MATFFEKNAQRIAQWNPRRRGGNFTAAQFTIHTFEIPAGTSALAGALILCRRADYGSYHWLADALRNQIHLAPWSAETWHSKPTNNWAVGGSLMMYAHTWRSLTREQRENLIYGIALGAAKFSAWLISQGRNPVPARFITREQAMRKEEGFIFHRDTDPGRRTDPANPRNDFPFDEFLAEYQRLLAELTGKTPTISEEEDDVKTEYLFVSTDAKGRKHHYGTMFPNTYVYVEDENAYITGREKAGREVEWWKNVANDRTVGRPREAFGVYVGPEDFRPVNG